MYGNRYILLFVYFGDIIHCEKNYIMSLEAEWSGVVNATEIKSQKLDTNKHKHYYNEQYNKI